MPKPLSWSLVSAVTCPSKSDVACALLSTRILATLKATKSCVCKAAICTPVSARMLAELRLAAWSLVSAMI